MKRKTTTCISSFFLWSMILVATSILFTSCEDDEEPAPTESVRQKIEAMEGLESLAELLDLRDGNDNPVFSAVIIEMQDANTTFFAPNNDAIAELAEAVGVSEISELRFDIVRDILRYHIVHSEQYLEAGQLSGDIETELDGETISANGTTLNETTQPTNTPMIVSPNLRATNNSIVHVIDHILLPSSITDDISPAFGTLGAYISMVNGFSQIDALLRSTNVWETIADPDEDYTLLAIINGGIANAGLDPTNIPSGFASDIANYHVVPGLPFDEQIFPSSVSTLLQGAPIYTTDLDEGVILANFNTYLVESAELSNGKIFIPVVVSNNNTVPFMLNPPSLRSSGVEYINRFDDLTLLARAVDRVTDIETILNGTSPFTLLSPNDDAFADAGITADDIDAMDVATLKALLENHIIQGELILAEGLIGTTKGNLSFAEGADNHVAVTDNNTQISAETVFENILLQVGIAHDIDKVLIP